MKNSTQSNEDLLPRLRPGTEWLSVRRGESGDKVYRRSDGVAYAKLSTATGTAALDGERHRVEWLASGGFDSPAVLDWTATDNGACLVMTTVPGVPASDLSAAELHKAWPFLVRQLKRLHEIPVEACPFDRSLATMFDRATDVVARGAVNPDFLAPDDQDVPRETLLETLRAELPARLAQEPGDRVVCHGDACLPNFMVDPDSLRCAGVIDLGRLGAADRYVDLSLLLANSRETWTSLDEAQTAHDRLFDLLAIPKPDAGRLAFYLRLDPLTWG